jgi:thioredoxin-like negative regulator of GroEL
MMKYVWLIILLFSLFSRVRNDLDSRDQKTSAVEAIAEAAENATASRIIEINDKQVKSLLLTSKGIVVLLVFAPDCPFSNSMISIMETISRAYPSLVMYKMDCFAQPASNFRFGVFGVPTVIVMNNGKEVSRFRGEHSESAVARFIREHTQIEPIEGSTFSEEVNVIGPRKLKLFERMFIGVSGLFCGYLLFSALKQVIVNRHQAEHQR